LLKVGTSDLSRFDEWLCAAISHASMQTKDLIGICVFFAATLGSVAACCLSRRVRDAAFFLMIVGLTCSDKLSLNFFSHYWYRGTTRGAEFTCMDALAIGVLVSSFLFPCARERRWFWPASFGLMLLFFAYACGNVIFSDPKIYGLFELSKMLRGIIFFLAAAWFVRGERELSILVLALAGAVCFESAIALKQRIFGGIYRVTGTIDDPNSFSMYLCTIAPVFVAAATSTLPKFLRRVSALAIASATLSVVLTISRAGIPVFAFIMLGTAALCVSWTVTAKKIGAVVVVAMCLAALLAKQWYLFQARFSQATLEEEYLDPNYDGRGYYLRVAKVIADDRFFGVGLNNWSYWVSKKYGEFLETPYHYEDYDDLTYAPSKEALPSFFYAAPAHNLAALTVGELGVPGLLLFALLWLRWFQMGAGFLWSRSPDAMHRLGIGFFFGTCGIFLQSVTEWVYHQTHIFLTFHILLGALAGLYWVKRESKRREIRMQTTSQDWQQLGQYEPAVA
jgi:membrane protein implicated in regulation of membrane protease activity